MVWVSAKRQERKPHVDGRMPHNNDQLNGPKAELYCRCRRQPKPNQSFFYELTKLFLLLVNSRVSCTSPVLHTDGSRGEWGWEKEKDHLSRLSLQWDAAPAFYCCHLQRCSRKSLLQFPSPLPRHASVRPAMSCNVAAQPSCDKPSRVYF